MKPVGGRRNSNAAVLALLLAAAAPSFAQNAPPRAAAKPSPASAHEAQPTKEEDTTVSELVVNGRPPAGSVEGDIKPDLVLTPQEVQSYGVSTVDDLLNELEPQTSTGPGSSGPVVLLNGRRISGFNEVRDVPTEAILRVEILPQEAALKYGYSADQRVVNIVLRPFFRARTAELSGGSPTAGGQIQGQGQLDYMRIRRDRRLNVALKVQDSTGITEDARNIVQPVSPVPFDPAGNVVSTAPGAEIDPALSALAGKPVVIAGVPQDLAGAPTLEDFIPTAGMPNVTDVGRYRTLAGASSSASANIVYTRPTVADVQATVNATFGATRSESLQGLPTLALEVPAGDPFSPFANPVTVAWDVTRFGPLRQVTDGWTAHLGTTLNRDTPTWRFTLTAAYDHASSETRTDAGVDAASLQQRLDAGDATFNPFLPPGAALSGMLPRNLASSRTDTANVHILASGPLLSLPAGKMNLVIHAGDVQSWYASSSTFGGRRQTVDLWRNTLNGRVNLDAPLARHGGVLGFLGDLTLNGNAAVDRLSDFGTLTAYGYGANWRPVTAVTLLVSRTHDSTAPSFQQSGGPVVITPGARVFDFATGQTVDVSLVSGGNPGLAGYSRDITRIGLMLRPLAKRELVITANYTRTLTRNPIETFPAATAQIQTLFPERFVRDDDGELTEVDYRPVNFASDDRSQLRWEINFTTTFGKLPSPPTSEERPGLKRPFSERARPFAQRRGAPPPGSGPEGQPTDRQAGPPPGPPGAGFGGRGGGPLGRGRGDQAPGRIQLALYHTIVFEDRLVVRPGGPVFDLLNGYPAGSGGGLARHQVEAQAGVTWLGLGARASAKWQSGTFINGDSSPAGALTFSPLATIDLRLFADFAQNRRLVARHPWLGGTRVTLSVSNLLDAHEKVRDATGATPVIYQPAYLDPVGRVVRLGVRKLFY